MAGKILAVAVLFIGIVVAYWSITPRQSYVRQSAEKAYDYIIGKYSSYINNGCPSSKSISFLSMEVIFCIIR